MEEKKESVLKQIWNDHKYTIISVGLVAMAYRLGYVRGYNASVNAVNAAFKALGEAIDVSKF